MSKTTICAGALAALVCAGSVRAHHSGSMYVTTPVWVKGTVVRFERVDPHTIVTIEERGADGAVRRWRVEGPAQSQLERLALSDAVPKVGDVIEFCAFTYKSADELSRMFPGVDFSARRAAAADPSSPQSAAGHVMVTAAGDRRVWEPHGVLGECILGSDEPRQAWLDFLDSSPTARQAWCQQRTYAPARSSAALRALAEEIDGSIDPRCE